MPERPGDFDSRETQAEQISETTAFLRRSFPHASHLTEDYLRWFYLGNPDGATRSTNCLRDGRIVGHVASMPLVANVHGQVERGVLIHNVATDPELGGRGLFTDLLAFALESAANLGFTFAIAVPNSQSVGAFVKRSGFTSLGPLEARIGIGRPPAPRHVTDFSFERIWSARALRWRVDNPSASYGWRRTADQLVVESDTGMSGIRVELASLDLSGELDTRGDAEDADGLRPHERAIEVPSGPLARLPIHLYLGIDSRRRWGTRLAIDLPTRLRPAPLNLVLRDLSAGGREWTRESTLFRGIDFDAY